MLKKIKNELNSLKNPEKAKIVSRYFKTGKGQYGEGDIFFGINTPEQRKIAKKFLHLSLNELQELLLSKIHEYRATALFILVYKYKKSDNVNKEKIFNFYVNNLKYVNNWDLVDQSAPYIIGDYLIDKQKDLLYKLVKSPNVWHRRISILSTFTFLKNNQFEDTIKISELLLNDKHDLIHKAVGWMLREIGKRNQNVEEEFLEKHYKNMPRIMLRYAIERFDEDKKKHYMNK